MPDGEKLLKRGLHRSVRLSASGNTVIKRLVSQGMWRRVTDGFRARREARMLTRLAELGLPVPRLIALDRARDGWELRIAALDGSCSLEELLGAAAAADFAPSADAGALGATLARFHACGFLHRDLHPGNLLVTPAGEWIMIDVAGGSLRRPLPRAAARNELVGLLGALRERTSAAWRRELWESWHKGLQSAAAPQPELKWDRVEDAARRSRHRSVLEHADRWFRPSSRLRPVRIDADSCWLVSVGEPQVEALLQALDPARVTLIRGPSARQHWLHATRAMEHGLSGLRPYAWNAARLLAVLEPTRTSDPRRLRAEDPGASSLADALADRGLWLSEPPLVTLASDD
jgi:tRNA A-37 threonylcarbamoyl transferase component Bud32